MQKQKKMPVSKKRSTADTGHKGFTLIELLIVMAVITILLAAAMGSMNNSRYTAAFFTAEEKVTSFLREARTYAITGKTVTDYTDFDGDGDHGDQVTPAGFGVAFNAGSTPGRIVLFADRDKVSPAWDDVAYVIATVIDQNGVVVPSASDLIAFKIAGPGLIVAVDSGNNSSSESFQASERRAYQGRCIAIIKAINSRGRIGLFASAPGLVGSSISIEAVAPVAEKK